MDEYLGFKIGDRVSLIMKDPCGYVKVGSTGVVCDFETGGVFAYGCDIGVEWDEWGVGFHDCCGSCKNGYGRYVPHEALRFIKIDFGEIDTDVSVIGALYESLIS